jgi:two-component system response regulator RegA
MNSHPQRILVCDDDAAFRRRLARSLGERGLEVFEVEAASQGLDILATHELDSALVDLRMPGESGLWFVREAHAQYPALRIVVLTGFGSIATALDAIRLGAHNYLTKPATVDQIIRSFLPQSVHDTGAITMPSLAEVEAEYVHRVIRECDGNVTQSAKVLGVHRRSLQRKLKR